jgi:hypothetical protein
MKYLLHIESECIVVQISVELVLDCEPILVRRVITYLLPPAGAAVR